MSSKTHRSFVASIVLFFVLIVSIHSPARARAGESTTRGMDPSPAPWNAETTDFQGKLSTSPVSQTDCEATGGWMWTSEPIDPDVARQAEHRLTAIGVNSQVLGRTYGESNNCGTFIPHGVDFTVTLIDEVSMSSSSQQEIADSILEVLTEFGEPNLGDVKVIGPSGETTDLNPDYETFMPEASAAALETDTITKNVYVLVYDPLLKSGKTLREHMRWSDPAVITQQTIDFFRQYSGGTLNYVVVETRIVTSGWPELIDGFIYTEDSYMAVWANPQTHHEPTGVNYNKIVDSPEFDICGRLNRGEIDELWLYGGPWFGYYESTLVGPGAYRFNSPPVSGAHTCQKPLPIMGPSYERQITEAIHNFGHRTEATMQQVYGSWQENNISHSWNKFGLVKAQSPDFSYSGCGSTHYPPNGTSDYNYSNSASALSNCDDFANYPNLSDPLQVAQPVTCSAWGCTGLGFSGYWFDHFPSVPGCGPDNVSTDWWAYIARPLYAIYPSNACQSNMHLISGNVGAGNATLNYDDGGAKTAAVDAYGNYFLMVSDHWSGTVTPSKAGYTFTPSNRNYMDAQADEHVQNYSATMITYTISGNAGAPNVTLTYTNGGSKTVTSDSSGNYTIVVPSNWSGSITPSKPDLTFSPDHLYYSAVQSDQPNKNYTAKVYIWGNAGISNVTIHYTDGSAKTSSTNNDGVYSLTVSYGWSGTITPSKAGYTFLPNARTFTELTTIQLAQDFAPTVVWQTISGNTGTGGTTLSYTHGTLQTLVSDANGDYSFAVQYNWSGTVTPSKLGYVFTPIKKTYSSIQADQVAQNYTATVSVIISGNAGTSGATLTYINAGTKTAVADETGKYAFTVPIGWTGTVTPSKTGFSFSPVSKSYSNLQTSQSGQDYGVTRIYTVSGTTGVGSVLVGYIEDGISKSVTSSSSGVYSFTVPIGWSGTVTPSKTGITFEPASLVFSNMQADQPEQNFKSIVFVTNTTDSEAGSLRQVIANASAGTTVRFDPSLSGQTITLASSIPLSKTMTIDGSGLLPHIEISGNDAVRIFSVNVSGNAVAFQSLILKNGNAGSTGKGGAIVLSASSVVINDVSFIQNTAYDGGAYYAQYNGTVTIQDSEFISNSSSHFGGAIYQQYGSISIQNTTFSNNSSTSNGGAIYATQAGTTIDASIFQANSSANGGAIHFQTVTNYSIVRNSLFTDNTATAYGGAIQVTTIYTNYSLTVENNTFHANRANNGGALSIMNTVHIRNNSFAQNQATNASEHGSASILLATPYTISLYNNLLTDKTSGSECALTGTGTQNLTGANNYVEDASTPCSSLPSTVTGDLPLGPFRNNGGPTYTMALPPDSLLIDAGDDANCPATDQRGVQRPQGQHCDIGAFEYGAEPTVTHRITLLPGWNLVSFRVHPADTSVASVLSSVDGSYDLVYAWDATGAHASSGNWLKADNIPASPDSLTILDEKMGFWIHMTGPDTLEVTGTVLQYPVISLLDNAGGWNLIGYPSSDNGLLPHVFVDQGVGTDFARAYAYHPEDTLDLWKLFDITSPVFVNDLTQLIPGFGYWVKVTADRSWMVQYMLP